jgi:hypothetical protein
MAHPVVWFEVTGKDGDRLRSFYCELFGWEFQQVPGADYGIVTGVQPGIPGGVGAADKGPAGPRFYIEVPDQEAALSQVAYRYWGRDQEAVAQSERVLAILSRVPGADARSRAPEGGVQPGLPGRDPARAAAPGRGGGAGRTQPGHPRADVRGRAPDGGAQPRRAGSIRQRRSDLAGAERLYQRALTTLERVVGGDQLRAASTRRRYASLLEAAWQRG